MAILGEEDAEIEVLLRKLPAAGPPSYLTEYAQTNKPDNMPQKVNRYIVPEGGAYGIEIILKKGFVSGKYDGLTVRLHDKRTQKVFHERTLISSLVKSGKRSYDHDKKFSITSIPQLSFDGNDDGSSRITFYRLCPDKTSFEKTIDLGYENKLVVSLEVELIRYCKPIQSPNLAVDPKEAEFQEKIKGYNRLAGALRNNVQAQDKSVDAAKAPQDYHDRVNYAPATQATKLIGGTEAGALLKPPERWDTCERETRRFNFFSCTQGLIDGGKFVNKSVPEECLPWDKLRSDAHRKKCFKLLQEHDRAMTLAQREAEARAVTMAEKNMIYKDLFNSGELPNKWRRWDHLYVREREPLFALLQDRRKYFDRGEYPPGPEASPNQSLSLKSRSPNAPSTPAGLLTLSMRTPESSTRQPPDELPTPAASLALSGQFLSHSPSRTPSSLNRETLHSPVPPAPISTPTRVAASKNSIAELAPPKPTRSEVITIDDNDDNSPRLQKCPVSNAQVINQSPVKSEPIEQTFKVQPIEVDAHPSPGPTAVKRTPTRSAADEDSPSKRFKLENKDVVFPQGTEDVEEELRKMEEEDERDMEELRQRQRIAELIQVRRERDARKAALLAKTNG